MNDAYVECLVSRKTSPIFKVLKGIIYFLCGACILLGAAGYTVLFIGAVIFGALIIWVVPGFNLEYEYLYLSKEIQIDKIMNKEKRKKVANINIDNMDFMCPLNSHELDSYKARNVKIADYSSGSAEVKPYVVVYHDNNAEKLVKIEPNAEMLKMIKSVCPRKVIEY